MEHLKRLETKPLKKTRTSTWGRTDHFTKMRTGAGRHRNWPRHQAPTTLNKSGIGKTSNTQSGGKAYNQLGTLKSWQAEAKSTTRERDEPRTWSEMCQKQAINKNEPSMNLEGTPEKIGTKPLNAATGEVTEG